VLLVKTRVRIHRYEVVHTSEAAVAADYLGHWHRDHVEEVELVTWGTRRTFVLTSQKLQGTSCHRLTSCRSRKLAQTAPWERVE
jgi:hypothetical protein